MKKFGTIQSESGKYADDACCRSVNNKKIVLDTADISIYFDEPLSHKSGKKRKY